MPLILIVVIIFAAIVIYLYKQHKKNQASPQNVVKVQELIQHLSSSKIQINFSIHDLDEGLSKGHDSGAYNIFELAGYNNKDVNEKYDEALILFDVDSNQLFDVENFVNSGLLPRIIVDELYHFQNVRSNIFEFTDNNDQAMPCVIIKSGVWIGDKINMDFELMQGDAKAFDSWSNLRESAQQLEFVIHQWLKDVTVLKN